MRGGRERDGTDWKGYDSSALICVVLLFYSPRFYLQSKGQNMPCCTLQTIWFSQKNNQDLRPSSIKTCYILSTIVFLFLFLELLFLLLTVHRESPLRFLHYISAHRSSTLTAWSSTSIKQFDSLAAGHVSHLAACLEVSSEAWDVRTARTNIENWETLENQNH